MPSAEAKRAVARRGLAAGLVTAQADRALAAVAPGHNPDSEIRRPRWQLELKTGDAVAACAPDQTAVDERADVHDASPA
jgi:hypothetical protein